MMKGKLMGATAWVEPVLLYRLLLFGWERSSRFDGCGGGSLHSLLLAFDRGGIAKPFDDSLLLLKLFPSARASGLIFSGRVWVHDACE